MPASDEQVIDGIGRRDLMPAPWMVDAGCADADPALFFVGHGKPGSEAKAICRTCRVRDACLDFALQSKERHGIWGGLTDKQRLAEARRRRQAA